MQRYGMAELYMLNSVRDTINTSFIIRDGGYTVALDGGFPCETDKLYHKLRMLGGEVDGWFLTHIHDDHVYGFLTLLKKYPDIRVKKVYCNFPSENFLEKYEPKQSKIGSVELLKLFMRTLEEREIELVTVCEDDEYRFGKMSVKVLQTPDESITRNAINNSSCVFRFTANGQKILFLGDLGVEGGNRLLERVGAEELRSDYVQMAHHGQSGVSKEVYGAIRPRFCLWCTPSWLWDNVDKKVGGYDTGRYKTVTVRGWISELGCVEKHYVMFRGDCFIEI